MTPIKVFYLERTNMVRQMLRRYHSGAGECGHMNNYGYHNNVVVLSDVEVPEMPPKENPEWSGDRDYHPLETNTSIVDDDGKIGGVIDANDPRWPTHCLCGHKFDDSVGKQYFPQRLYRRVDTGELYTLRDAPVGAMWLTDYSGFAGPDGKCLHVRLPGKHDWMVDSRASNCTKPDDKEHRCWVRHGDPKTGNVHVDKNGLTCDAGAGSIVVPGFHGFLHNGHIVSC
jgi:hypothetical protein